MSKNNESPRIFRQDGSNPVGSVPLLGERLSHPAYHRAHARGAAQIAVNDDPVFGGEFGDPRGLPLEQRMPVADIARQYAAAGTGARIASKCMSIDEARSATGIPVSSTWRCTQRAGA